MVKILGPGSPGPLPCGSSPASSGLGWHFLEMLIQKFPLEHCASPYFDIRDSLLAYPGIDRRAFDAKVFRRFSYGKKPVIVKIAQFSLSFSHTDIVFLPNLNVTPVN